MFTEERLDIIDHVAISARDIGEAVRWYTQTFRCKILYQDETWALLGFGNTKLAIVHPSQHPSHIAFVHSEAEKFGSLTPHRDGTSSVYVADPAGNAVEILKQT